MNGHWMQIGLVFLVVASTVNAEPEEMTASERAELEAKARNLNRESIDLYGQGKFGGALNRARQALAIREKLYPATQFPQGHKDLAVSLNNTGRVLESLGQLERALDHYQQALAMVEKLYNPKEFPQGHPYLARINSEIGIVLEAVGRFDEALKHHQQAHAVYLKLYPAKQFPEGHLDLATALNNMGLVLQSLKRMEESLDYFQQNVAMLHKLYPAKQFPQGHPYLATAMNNVGHNLRTLGQLEESLEQFQQALAMRKKLYPPKQFPQGHPDLALSLSHMGLVYQSLGRLEGGMEFHQQALAAYRKLYPENRFPQGHPDLARTVVNLVSIFALQGQEEKALDQFQLALAMRQKLYTPKQFPRGHPDLVFSLNDIGDSLNDLGRLDGSLEHYQQALAICKKLYSEKDFPQGHEQMAMTLVRMGHVLQSLGRLEGALDAFQQALAIDRKVYPAKLYPRGHQELARCLNNMGRLLEQLGRKEESLKCYQEALEMNRKLFPKKHFPHGHLDLAANLNNMGGLFIRLGRLDEALEHSQQALAMVRSFYPEKEFPDGHTNLAASMNTLGTVFQLLGRLNASLESYNQAEVMLQKLFPANQFPEGHANLAKVHNNIGAVLHFAHRNKEAMVAIEKALAMQRGLADRFAQGASEGEALAFNRATVNSLSIYLSATRHLTDTTSVTYARVWIDRAPVNRILLQRHQGALTAASANPEVRKLFGQLQTTRRDLAQLLLRPLPTVRESLKTRDRQVNELTETKQQLERALVRLLPDLYSRRHDSMGPKDLRQALPPGAVFVDVLRYNEGNFDPQNPGDASVSWIPHYVAFVVRGDADVQRVELGVAKPIEEALADYLHLIEDRREQDSPKAAATLRRLVWDPIAEKLPQETHTVYLAPDGDLTRLPWAALPGSKKDTILLEDYALALVPHGPFLLGQLQSERRFGQGKGTSLVLGGVRYSDTHNLAPDVLAKAGPDPEGTKGTWIYLQGTERELKLVQNLAGKDTLALAGKDASVPRLLSALPQARVAHLATHGFFNQKEYRLEKERAQKQATEVLRSPEVMSDHAGQRITAGAQNPLAYTGLVLAGANVPDKAGLSGGILTGESIVDLDLRKMELAVLSACQTGLGEAENGECVHNLQIAFHVAGCTNVAASLWNVPDESTAALMGLFYRELLDGGKPPLEALRSAQLYLYHNPGEIKQLAERGPPLVAKGGKLPKPEVKPGTPDPAQAKRAAVKDWAAFVLSGVGR